MTFVEMRDKLIEHFNKMVSNGATLFAVKLDKDKLWETYLNSFTDEQNPIFKVRREYDCSCCRHFIKQIGNVVTITDGILGTIWDIPELYTDPDYGCMLDSMGAYIRQQAITDGIADGIENVFISREAKIGVHHNFALYPGGERHEFNHFYLELPERYVVKDSVARNAKLNDYKTGMEAFERALKEIDIGALDTVIELCESNNLYRGDAYYKMVKAFRDYKIAYHGSFTTYPRFAWENSVKAGFDVCRIRNCAIGTLLVDLSKGVNKQNKMFGFSNYEIRQYDALFESQARQKEDKV